MRTSYSVAALLLAALASPAAAQHRQPGLQGPPQLYLGADFAIARPTGEFQEYVDGGLGGNLHLLYRPARTGVFALRVDGGFIQYGSETRPVLLSPTIGGRITVDLTTTNSIAYLGVGPQIGLPGRRLQPYVNGTLGFAYFATTSSLEGDYDEEPLFTTENYSDATLMYGAGAGLYIPILRGDVPLSLDIGARYQHNGRVSYLREGDIRDNPDNSITISPVESQANLVNFHIGVTAGIRDRDRDRDRDRCRRWEGERRCRRRR